MDRKVTPVVEGGLLTAIAVILGLAATYLPVLGLVVEFFCAVPFAVLTVRHGVKIGTTALIVTFILLSMFATPIVSARLFLTMNLCGVVLGCCLNKNIGAAKTFLATLTTAFVSQIVFVIILAAIMGINFSDMELTTLKESFAESFKFYESLGVEKNVLEEMRVQSEKIVELVAYLIPLILFLLSLVNAIACYILSKWIFAKLKLKFAEPLPPFAEWRFSATFAYLSAFAILGLYWGATRDWNLIYTVSLNSAFFLFGLGLVEGFSILSFVADRYKVSKFWRRIAFVCILLNSLLAQIVAFTGIFDMLFDYRKKFSAS